MDTKREVIEIDWADIETRTFIEFLKTGDQKEYEIWKRQYEGADNEG